MIDLIDNEFESKEMNDVNTDSIAVEHSGEMTVEINREWMAWVLDGTEQRYPDMNLVEISVNSQALSDLINKQFNIVIGG